MTGQENNLFSFDTEETWMNTADFHQSFVDEEQEILFIHFSKLGNKLAREVLAWRNHPEVRRWMYNKDVISEEDHFEFLEQLPRQRHRYYWLVKEGDKDLGVIDLSNCAGGESEWGFYLNPKYIGGGKALRLFHHALHFFFRKIRLNKVYGYVACENNNSLLLNELFDMKLAALMPKQHNGVIHWYAKYELNRGEFLTRGVNLSEVRRKLIGSQSVLRRKRREIRLRQLLIQAFGRPGFPWREQSDENSTLEGFEPSTNSIQLSHFCRLLKEDFDIKLDIQRLLTYRTFSDLLNSLEK
ncbi:MAG: UDP-4-amino-4,6-dideoxy-N-acetyl-beta-L-altrosamine N-acetyltransferase [Saprospiraceae bacterium]|nr:UDP-4-amino-4,6-dideoxy-N-acetyl-beta-L-altrosamine N-acetyltransferase [Saprospiraceae bacterium]